ncbi:MAG: hypothetical protein JW971_03945 [Synergistales bacterium]|nr:hypothetical protein [Synergistales bacterium]
MIEQQLEIPGSGALHENFIPIKPGYPSSTLYCLFFNSDDITARYGQIAYSLPEKVRVIGIDRPASESFRTIEEYAIDSAERIIDLQKEGPVHLAGFCFGGLIALKTALILEEKGYDVNCCLIDIPYHRKKFKYYIEYGAYYYLARKKWLYTLVNSKLKKKLRRNAKKYNYKTLWSKELYFKGPCILFLGKYMCYRDSDEEFRENLSSHFEQLKHFSREEHHLDLLIGHSAREIAAAIGEWFNS